MCRATHLYREAWMPLPLLSWFACLYVSAVLSPDLEDDGVSS